MIAGGVAVAESVGAEATEGGEETVGDRVSECADCECSDGCDGDVDGDEGGYACDFGARKDVAVDTDYVDVAGIHRMPDFVGKDAPERAKPVDFYSAGGRTGACSGEHQQHGDEDDEWPPDGEVVESESCGCDCGNGVEEGGDEYVVETVDATLDEK